MHLYSVESQLAFDLVNGLFCHVVNIRAGIGVQLASGVHCRAQKCMWCLHILLVFTLVTQSELQQATVQ